MATDALALARLRRELNDVIDRHFTGVTEPTPAGRAAIEEVTARYGTDAVTAVLAELEGPRYRLPIEFR